MRADNPSPYTLEGTNTWLVGRDPCWIVDPGPDLAEHVEAVVLEAQARGGVGGIALTHGHLDHAGAVAPLRERTGAPAPAPRADGDVLGPLTVVATGGHAPDHVVFVAGDVAFTGDAVLGRGSVFVAPGPGSLSGYLDALARLRDLGLVLLCPGHGPPITDPTDRLDGYVAAPPRARAGAGGGARRRAAQRRRPAGPRLGRRAPGLRMAATITLASHLGKLDEEGRLPDGVEEPVLPTLPTV